MEQSTPKRVFISYSHDSPPHMEWVLKLASRLRSDGVDAWIDRYAAAPPEGWPRWMQRQIQESDFIILVCTKNYKARFEGRVPAGEGNGATWEGLIANQILYEDASRNHFFIPVIPPYGDLSDIPIILRSFTCYDLKAHDQYDALYRHITGQPEVLPDPLGEKNPAASPKFGPWLSMYKEKTGEALAGIEAGKVSGPSRGPAAG